MSYFVPIGNIIENLIKELSHKGFSREIRIALLWNRTVGKILSRKAQITKLENNILFINVENNVWLQELVLQKSKILEKINRKLNPSEQIQNMFFSISDI
ncbi:MAG: DUF721 domain-containing protein [Candidatus Cloacimonetes bacterium]|nr:DUF721 domain-containing protein [Candidatus Cloacimonadota bacterium]